MTSSNRSRILLIPLLVVAWCGCIYTNVTSPLAWRAPTPAEVPASEGRGPAEEVRGEACMSVILWLIAVGEAGYNDALKDALSRANGATTLSDVKADTSSFSILGVYQKHCSIVQGHPVRL
ncbi:MAG: hypothetical protein HYY13_13555 [Nitrospirae bacterium]|nr:hypothetical protein [Nitrospirota bacterium]